MNDLFIKVGGLVFLADFVILDVNKDTEVPIILGHPLLATSRALLDIQNGKMTLRASDEEAIFKLPEAMKHPIKHDDTSYSDDDTNLIICDCVQEVLALNLLEKYQDAIDVKKVKHAGALRGVTKKVMIESCTLLKKKSNSQEGPPWKNARRNVCQKTTNA